MGLFDKDNTGQLEALQNEVLNLREVNKKGSAELASAREQTAELKRQLIQLAAEVETAKAAVSKTRKRQKNSVERANRFKSLMQKMNQSNNPVAASE